MAIVYRHIRKDKNEPFYIGIGHNVKRAFKKSQRNEMWNYIVAKTEYEVEIMFEDMSWDFCKEKEIELISLYGRKDLRTGTLCNMTSGGEGVVGNVVSDETKVKMSDAKKKNPSKYWKGKKMSKEHKEKLSESRTGKPNPKTIICNLQSGIFHMGYKEVAETYNINIGTLSNKLNNHQTNNTYFVK